jgi:hypothetical protein
MTTVNRRQSWTRTMPHSVDQGFDNLSANVATRLGPDTRRRKQ